MTPEKSAFHYIKNLEVREPDHKREEFYEKGYAIARFRGQTFIYASYKIIEKCGGLEKVQETLTEIFGKERLKEHDSHSYENQDFFTFEVPSLIIFEEERWDTEKEEQLDQFFIK